MANDKKRLAALIVDSASIASDQALAKGGRGARKIVSITDPFVGKERIADETYWAAAPAGELTPIVIADNWEMAIFNEVTKQDRHVHKVGTEIYMVREGTMIIEVEGQAYTLKAGDSIIVLPGSAHEVLLTDISSFLTQLVCTNCGGPADKYDA